MSSHIRNRCIAGLLCALAGATHAQPLGRLFFTDEERARLDLTRGQPTTSRDRPRATGSVRNDGVITRSGGSATWFVNGAATDAQALSGQAIQAHDRQLTLTGEDGQPLTLKPGEQATLDEAGRARPSGPMMDIRTGRVR